MKVDFEIELDDAEGQGIPADAVKPGQELAVALDADSGALRCTTAAGVALGSVPAAAARQLQGALRVTVRSVKKRPDAPDRLAAVQARAVPADGGATAGGAAAAGGGPQHQQAAGAAAAAAPPPDDPSGYAVTVAQLRRLAEDKDVVSTLQDPRLQELLLAIDGAGDREKALAAALEREPFRRFADGVLAALGGGGEGAGAGAAAAAAVSVVQQQQQ